MNYELFIRSGSQSVDFALLKDGKLIELHKEEDDNKFSVGDVFIAKTRKIVPGLNATFVNIGYEKGKLHKNIDEIICKKYKKECAYTDNKISTFLVADNAKLRKIYRFDEKKIDHLIF